MTHQFVAETPSFDTANALSIMQARLDNLERAGKIVAQMHSTAKSGIPVAGGVMVSLIVHLAESTAAAAVLLSKPDCIT